MLKRVLKSCARRLPATSQQTLKSCYYAWQIKRNQFLSREPEFRHLQDLVAAGDWVVDIGANVGHYTLAMSKLVGPAGRVIAIEPVFRTFQLLAQNCLRSPYENITLLNVAASERGDLASMRVPSSGGGNPGLLPGTHYS